MRGICSPEQLAVCPLSEHYSDNDHIAPQRLRFISWLVSKYIDTPDNQQQLCRWEHLQKTESPIEDPDYCIPEQRVMVDAIRQAYNDGQISLNKKDRQRLNQIQQLLEIEQHEIQFGGDVA